LSWVFLIALSSSSVRINWQRKRAWVWPLKLIF